MTPIKNVSKTSKSEANWVTPDPIPAVDAPTIMVVINRAWREGDDDDAVYQSTHAHWRIGRESRERAVYVLGVAGGIVRGAYRVESWYPSAQEGEEKRWGFHGVPAPELHVVGTSVKRFAPAKGASNPVRLFPDGVSAVEAADIASLSQQLNAEPLARIMFGQRELFHSNLLAWFFDEMPGIADQVFLPLARPGDGLKRTVERERGNLDLVFQWPGYAPLVIENKVFSVPSLSQLDGYSAKIRRWQGTPPELCLLSMIEPPIELSDEGGEQIGRTGHGWRHLSYDSLADRIDDALEGMKKTYEIETMHRYSRVVRLVSALIASTSISSAGSAEPAWLDNAELDPISSAQTRSALHKMRAARLAAMVNSVLPSGGDQADPGMSHGRPLVTWNSWMEREDHSVWAGWQLQDGQFRRFVITPHILGATAEKKAERVAFARRNPDLFSFTALAGLFGDADLPVRPSTTQSGFGDFSPDFVYQYLAVPAVTVSQLMNAAQWIQSSISASSESRGTPVLGPA